MKANVALVLLAACGGSSAPAPPPPVGNRMDIVVLDPPPADALVLDVRAVRWVCSIKHPKNVETAELRVPVGRPIKLVVWTPEPPQWAQGIEVSLVGTNIKKAVRKDQPVEIGFRIDRAGEYAWLCPTITPPPPKGGGERSAEARAYENPVKPLYAVPAAEYDAMLAANDPDDPANQLTLGRKLYEKKGCSACHTIDGSVRVGPSWKGIWGTKVTLADGSTAHVDAAYVKRSIIEPQAFARPGYPPAMPSFDGQLREGELDALVAFIASLADPKP
jgi:cytochrome c oxidase subunit II